MKKYLMTAIAALAMGGTFTSCGPSMDSYGGNIEDYVKQSYEQKFIERFGEPAPNQTWGFGSTTVVGTRGMTRGEMPATPSFRDTNPIVKPTVPTGLQNTVPAGAHYAQDYQNYQNGDVIYVNTAYSTLNNPQNTENLTIYVDGNVTLTCSFKQDGGTKIVVTEKSTLKLGSMGYGIAVYLAPGATLDITEGLTENVISYWPYQSEIVKNGNNSFTFQNANAAIYMASGAILKAADLKLVGGAKLLNDGGTITANSLTMDQNCVMWNNGPLTVKSLTLTNSDCSLYNAADKTITAETINLINNNALLFNEGTVSATGDIVLHNTNAEVINYGSLSCASYSQAAGGKTHNHGTITMSGKTNLTNSNSTWMNDGQWTCGSFDIDNYSHTNINNCRLTVNGNFHLNRGTFVLGANSGVVCDSFTWEDTSDFYLGNSSVLKINGNLLTRNANSGYGLRAIGTEYAVVQAASIIHEGNEQFRMSYYGKLLVATQNHFEQWYKDAPNTNQPAYWYESSVKFTKDGNNIATIPANDCNPGYEGNADEIKKIRVIAEDLTVNDAKSDFDFNDVVFDVIWNKTQNVVSVELLAAGGELTIYVGGDENGVGDIRSVNEYFILGNPDRKDDITDKTMINTVFDPNNPSKDYKHEFKTYKYDLKKGWSGNSIEEIANSIYVRVIKSNKLVTLTAEKGRTASKIAVGIDYDWCDERQDIDTKFSGKFSEYVKGAHSWDTWYKK